jgi:hypothetical protein
MSDKPLLPAPPRPASAQALSSKAKAPLMKFISPSTATLFYSAPNQTKYTKNMVSKNFLSTKPEMPSSPWRPALSGDDSFRSLRRCGEILCGPMAQAGSE